MWSEGLQTSQLWCLHGRFSILGCLEGFPAQQGTCLLGALTQRHHSFCSLSPTHANFPDAEFGTVYFQILFLKMNESRDLVEDVILWKPMCCCSASPTPALVLMAPADALPSLYSQGVTVAGTCPFTSSIATK